MVLTRFFSLSSGVTSHGLSCGVCKLKCHKGCVANVLPVCKWTTLDTVDPACITVDNDVSSVEIGKEPDFSSPYSFLFRFLGVNPYSGFPNRGGVFRMNSTSNKPYVR